MQKQTPSSILLIVAGTLVLGGAILALMENRFGLYLFSGGTVGLIFMQALLAYEKRNDQLREKRLSRIGVFTSILLVLAAYSMYKGTNSWVVLVLIYALSSFFLSFRGDK